MRGYLITLLAIAFLVGSLFRATEMTGMRIWNMFATFGIFLFGVVGSLALTRLQLRSGVRGVQEALKALEPEWVITDWSGGPGVRPDYLLVGPSGLLAVCVDHTAGSALSRQAKRQLQRARERARRSADWVRSELAAWPEAADLPVVPVLLLSRRRALPECQEEGVPVLNPDQLGAHLQAAGDEARVGRQVRWQVTRRLRALRLPQTV